MVSEWVPNKVDGFEWVPNKVAGFEWVPNEVDGLDKVDPKLNKWYMSESDIK